ncbi:hypothetical protein [Anaerotruncus colihominis]|uniref:hypothetical protein n=1 Tax=Anaerotruncus colihominis TaxID=169435 RepID=UPI001899E5E5|nr:hypothetical protein [Anaerotruncus colihominis]
MKKLICIIAMIIGITGCTIGADGEMDISEPISKSSTIEPIGSASSIAESAHLEEAEAISSENQQNTSAPQFRSHDSVWLQTISQNSEPVEVSVGDTFQGLKVESLIYEEMLIDEEWKLDRLVVQFSGEIETSGVYFINDPDYFLNDSTSNLPTLAEFPISTMALVTEDDGPVCPDILKKYYEDFKETQKPVEVQINRLLISNYCIRYLYGSDGVPSAEVVSMTLAEDE